MIKRSIVLVASLCMLSFAVPASAQSLDCQKLDLTSMTPDQIRMAQTFCASAAPAAQAAQTAAQITPDKVREWASIGKDFSTAIVETANGLGQTANQFLFTPVGIMIAFYFMWGKIGGIIIGIPLLISLWFLYAFICGRFGKASIEYENIPIFGGVFTTRKIKKIEYDKESEEITRLWGLMAIPTLGISALIIFNLIF
jgi:hypothetical protein